MVNTTSQQIEGRLTPGTGENIWNTLMFDRSVPSFQKNSAPYIFTSCLCCSHHFRTPLYAYWCKAIAESPRFHRKQWEFVFISHALYERNMLSSGKSAIGFGVGKEPLVALFASRGVEVLASDLDTDEAQALGWVSTNQHSSGRATLNERNLCNPSDFERLVSFRNIDMNKIPSNLGPYDFCWSSCSLEHLGSLRLGMNFVLNSCKLLKPGGVAIHTTEFNLSSNDATVDNNKSCVIYRRRDIETLVSELESQGYQVETLDFYSGHDPLDKHVDLPPYASEPHLRLLLDRYTSTSIGLIIHRPIEPGKQLESKRGGARMAEKTRRTAASLKRKTSVRRK